VSLFVKNLTETHVPIKGLAEE